MAQSVQPWRMAQSVQSLESLQSLQPHGKRSLRSATTCEGPYESDDRPTCRPLRVEIGHLKCGTYTEMRLTPRIEGCVMSTSALKTICGKLAQWSPVHIPFRLPMSTGCLSTPRE